MTAAFSQLSQAPYPAQCRMDAVETLSSCAGDLGMVGGQVLDMQSEQRVCTEQEVLDVQSRKTGALIRAACVLGVLAGDGTESQRAAAETFAGHLGVAFQIRDDMLDVIGDAQTLGKATGVDAGKNTFVRLYGLEKCEELVKDSTEKALEALRVFANREYMTALATHLTTRIH